MFPRSARKVSNVALSQLTHQSTFANAPILSSFTHKSKIGAIHTKKQQHKSPNTAATQQSSRWFTSVTTAMPSLPTMALPSLSTISSFTSSLSPKKMTERLGQFVGNSAMAHQNNRVMQRVWAKRQQRLYKATSAVMEVFRSNALQFESAEIYVRTAGMFDDAEDNGQREVHIALRGIAHTVVVLRSECGCTYLVDRVVEGIRLTALTVDGEGQIEECPKFKPQEMLRLSTYRNLALSGAAVADWVEEEGKNEYNVITNSCVNFSYYFHQHFLRGLKTRQFIDSVKAQWFGNSSPRTVSSEHSEQ